MNVFLLHKDLFFSTSTEAVVVYLALQLLQRIFVPSGKNPAPTRDTEHTEH